MLDVFSYVNEKKAAMKDEVAKFKKYGHTPRMAIITASSSFDANQSYIRSKTAFAMDVGVACDVIVFEPGEEPFPNLDAYDGVIIQYPFYGYPFDVFRFYVSGHIPAEKDIDGLGYESLFKPCTPLGIVHYIDHLRKTGVVGEHVSVHIIGAGGLVGRPLAEMLVRDPSVSVCVSRSSTPDYISSAYTHASDVIVCATPKANLINWTHSNKVYIDCGCSLVDGKLLGNVSRDCYGDDELITPVPNGVGRLTVLSLFENLLCAFYKKIGIEASC